MGVMSSVSRKTTHFTAVKWVVLGICTQIHCSRISYLILIFLFPHDSDNTDYHSDTSSNHYQQPKHGIPIIVGNPGMAVNVHGDIGDGFAATACNGPSVPCVAPSK